MSRWYPALSVQAQALQYIFKRVCFIKLAINKVFRLFQLMHSESDSPHRDVDSKSEQPISSIPPKLSLLTDWLKDMPNETDHDSDEPFEPDGDDYETTDDGMTVSKFLEEGFESNPDSPSFKRFLIRGPPVQGCQTESEAEASYRQENGMFIDIKTFLEDRRRPQTPERDGMHIRGSDAMAISPMDCMISRFLTRTLPGPPVGIGALLSLVLCSECPKCRLLDNDRIRPTLDALENTLIDLRRLLNREISDRMELDALEQ